MLGKTGKGAVEHFNLSVSFLHAHTQYFIVGKICGFILVIGRFIVQGHWPKFVKNEKARFLLHFLIHIHVVMLCRKFELIPI